MSQQQHNSIADNWARLETWLARHMPEMLQSLNPGATTAEIQEVEQELGFNLPEVLKEFYTIHNGQQYNPEGGLLYGMNLRSLNDIAQFYRDFDDIYLAKLSLAEPGQQLGHPALDSSGKVRPQDMSYLWIPFATRLNAFTSAQLCLDLDPASSGVKGQVIAVADNMEKMVVANSFDAFFDWFISSLIGGDVIMNDTFKRQNEIELDDPESIFFLNAL